MAAAASQGGFLANLLGCSINAVYLSLQKKKKNQKPQPVILIILLLLYTYIGDTCAMQCSVWPLLLLLLLLLLLWRIILRRVCGIGF
jgi:hypothetical protein